MNNGTQSLALVPVILSGGSGTRLWPMSRQFYPKQFIPLIGNRSLFQATLQRLEGLENSLFTLVVCNNEHRFMAAEQLRQNGADGARIMLEPVGRNTAPAIAGAALEICAQAEDAIMLVLPADHAVKDSHAFRAAVDDARVAAAAGRLVTFGIVPERAETGYGYIRRGERLKLDRAGQSVFAVDIFKEKPDRDTAEKYLASGDYLWNSGIFCFSARRYLEELQQHAPKIHAACAQAHAARVRDLDFIRLDEVAFAVSPDDSIDYAVMEKTGSAAVIPLACGWSDVGSWHSLWEAEPHDANDNIEVGDVVGEDCHGCYIHAGHRLVGAVGLEDQIIIETADAVLVAPRARAQDTRRIVEQLKSRGRNEAIMHRKVFRPWGAYEGIDLSNRFQVKRITVNPGQSLSLQMHHHRAEHWVVVTGTARVTRGDEVFLLNENESTFIPTGLRHRLENPGKITLELIEVQSGSYLGEDDIVRFEDNYGR
ncbi:MAG TPA: mannose-1-phosphate guanylyltransferase/mannose-6-phosphate isomerase [Gammaproteobacteria bacterium]|nr:mannose-1-phosphate guanylyltransferase/mannose-6-phosphate isomerase [Gammaproteobacteria bacterium]